MRIHKTLLLVIAALAAHLLVAPALAQDNDPRPNFLFAIADDWGWPHASAYGDQVVQTPAFDRIAREGVLFDNAFVSSPSCTPSRGAILTGQHFWRLKAGANLWCIFPNESPSYVEVLQQHGYTAGHAGKAWGPGRQERPDRQIAGPRFKGIDQFLAQRDTSKPFVFWLGSSDPHRPYKPGSGADSGMDLSKAHLFPHSPDNQTTRADVADYYWEVQRFDALVGQAITALEEAGLLDNTIVVVTGDHGMPFPRSKGNLYDSGTRVPLAIRMPGRIPAGRTIADLASLTDIAPTFLQLAGVEPPDDMTGRSLLPLLSGGESGRTAFAPDAIYFGRERHVPCQDSPDTGGYPSRAIRTNDFLYIRNFSPDRWPAGTPDYEHAASPGAWFGDCDDSPTKRDIIAHADDDPAHQLAFELAFAKRPAEELYDLRNDPGQVRNLAANPAYAKVRQSLASQLETELRRTGDPRVEGQGKEAFEHQPYLGGGGGKHPDWKPPE
jgi:N-sulfoglucosamine sulfohydrolase